jgi:hypothetical protein
MVLKTRPDREGLISEEVQIFMAITWGSLDTHQDAWTEAKRRKQISDVRDLSTAQFRELLALAEQIRKELEQ